MKDVYYLLEVPDPADHPPLRLLKAVRDAMRVLHPRATAQQAEACIEAARTRGFGILGASENEGDDDTPDSTFYVLMENLPDGCAVGINIDTDARTRKWQSRRMTAEGATPEQVFAEVAPGEAPAKVVPIAPAFSQAACATAVALMIPADGNPLQAAGNAYMIGRASGQPALYAEVVKFLAHVCPWIEQPLRNAGYWE